MANTLTEYEYLTNDPVKAGIAHTILVENPLLRDLPFKGIASNTIKYKMETVEADARAYEVGEEWVEGAPTWEARTADLAIIGGDADVDNFIVSTMGAQENVAAEVIALKAKAIANYFANLAIYGRTTATSKWNSSKNFKGLLRLMAELEGTSITDLDGGLEGGTADAHNTQVLVASSNSSAALTMELVDELLDMVRPNATHLLSSRAFRRKLSALARASGQNLNVSTEFGFPVTMYGDVKIIMSDAVPDNLDDPSTLVTALTTFDDTQTRGAADDITPVFALRVAEDGVCGITSAQNGMIQTEPIGVLQNKDAVRTRIKFYSGLAIFNKLSASVMTACCMTD